ncbi:hypothetical protein Purlil1_13106 [Purpureocillium lilacinum]|uniref:Uncharacterized protein n=1 Tax=Purpureocillium lilacinum TaxID=33203 RepID=A0ABR0BEZ3_PURLI|nr:hypothetical protein Purlil1_13106 [Purpureocillium lilacinum]
MINHLCAPNSMVQFIQQTAALRAERSIAAGGETETSEPPALRRRYLRCFLHRPALLCHHRRGDDRTSQSPTASPPADDLVQAPGPSGGLQLRAQYSNFRSLVDGVLGAATHVPQVRPKYSITAEKQPARTNLRRGSNSPGLIKICFVSVDFLAHTRREERLSQQLGGVTADEGQHGPEGSNQASKDRLGALVPDAARLWAPAPLQVAVLPEGISCSRPESCSKTMVATGRGERHRQPRHCGSQYGP